LSIIYITPDFIGFDGNGNLTNIRVLCSNKKIENWYVLNKPGVLCVSCLLMFVRMIIGKTMESTHSRPSWSGWFCRLLYAWKKMCYIRTLKEKHRRNQKRVPFSAYTKFFDSGFWFKPIKMSFTYFNRIIVLMKQSTLY